LATIRCFECGDEGHIAADCPNRAITSSGKPLWCGICDERTRLIPTPDGFQCCHDCHPLARRQPHQFRRCPKCHVVIYEWDTSQDCDHHATRRDTVNALSR
jgi:hypothetical protein